ncbi:saccharopine dehydrogenase family protein [Scopulibacillus cellulosilyticus]|uniref:SDR family NAD(P)-dependent oxidoreductase n=1 Tax=Scopulibacillus cellulosilyticus TaxID=2665665 RepID=A0ABW2PW08_9BACL
MKEVVVIGAAGNIGQVIVKDLVESGAEVIAADLNEKKLQELEKWAGKNIAITPLDIKDQAKVKEVIKQGKVCVNASNYMFNIDVMRAAAAVGVNMLDLGGLYTMTKDQLALDASFKEAGILALIGMGSDPGVSNICSRYGVDMLDSAEEIHIRYGSTTTGLTFSFAIDTIIDEAIKNALVVRDGELCEIPALSGEEFTQFHDKLGVQKTYSILHSELGSLPQSFPQVKEITYKDTWDETTIEKLKSLNSLGLLRNQPVESSGEKIIPRRQIISLLQQTLQEEPEWGIDELLVEIKGKKGEKQSSVKFEILTGQQDDWGVTALAYATGVPASIAAQMLLKGEIEGEGVLPPEQCVNPKKFLSYLSQKNVELYMTCSETENIKKHHLQEEKIF